MEKYNGVYLQPAAFVFRGNLRIGKSQGDWETRMGLPHWVTFNHIEFKCLHSPAILYTSMHTFDTFSEIHAMLDAVPGLSTAIRMEKAMTFVCLAT